MSRKRRNLQNLSWFLVGTGVGTVVSTLLASKAVEVLRQELASSSREGTANMRRRPRQAVETWSEFADHGRQKISEVVEKRQDAVENGRSLVGEYVERATDEHAEPGVKP